MNLTPEEIMALITGGLATIENITSFITKLKAQNGITDDQLLAFASQGDADGSLRTQLWIEKLNASAQVPVLPETPAATGELPTPAE